MTTPTTPTARGMFHHASAGRARTWASRFGAALILAGVVFSVQMAQPVTDAAAATPHPLHEMEKVACMGGGNYGQAWDFIEPYVPVIYAYDHRPGVVESQDVAFRVRLNRWTGSGWVVDPQAGAWSTWSVFRTFDADASSRYITGVDGAPSGIRLKVPKLGLYYAVSFQVAWKDAVTGSWTYSSVRWAGAHLNLINGNTWIADRSLGFFGCDFVPDYGYVALP